MTIILSFVVGDWLLQNLSKNNPLESLSELNFLLLYFYLSFPSQSKKHSCNRHYFNRHCHHLKRDVSRRLLESRLKMGIVNLQNGPWSWQQTEQGRAFLQPQLIAVIRKTNYPLMIAARVVPNQKIWSKFTAEESTQGMSFHSRFVLFPCFEQKIQKKIKIEIW